jgi:hypothetical protein
MQARLLAKIEELTLHMVQMDKEQSESAAEDRTPRVADNH